MCIRDSVISDLENVACRAAPTRERETVTKYGRDTDSFPTRRDTVPRPQHSHGHCEFRTLQHFCSFTLQGWIIYEVIV